MKRHVGAFVGLLVALAVLGPGLLRPGFWLHYDMVFVPHLGLGPATLALDGGVPRAVPNDTVVALLDLVLPGWITQRLVLLGAFVAIGAGVDRWRREGWETAVAAVVLTWNPWIGERLAIGHWGYLWGYAALVWAVVGALQWRRGAPQAAVTVIAAVVMGALSGSTGAVLVLVALVVLLAWPGPGRARGRVLVGGAAAWLVCNAAWWFPFLLLAPSARADAAGVGAFAARADSAGGVVVSLLGGGGIWHRSSWFVERMSLPIALASALVLVVGVVALARDQRPGRGLGAVATLGGAGLLLAAAGAFPGLREGLTWVVLHVPGGGLLRDGQKFAALWVVPAALGCGVAVGQILRRTRGTLLAPVVFVGALVLPVALLPGLAWERGGRWAPVQYPANVQRVAAELGDARDDGALAVLPWSTYRRYGWNDERVLLDPWNRLVTRRVVSDDTLALRGGEVQGENLEAADVARALGSNDPASLDAALQRSGVRYVVVQRDQPQAAEQERLLGRSSRLLVDDDGLALYERRAAPDPIARPPWWASLGLVSSLLGIVGLAIAPVLARCGIARRGSETR